MSTVNHRLKPITEACAAVELANLGPVDLTGNLTTFPGMPTSSQLQNIKLPYSYGLWLMTETRDPDPRAGYGDPLPNRSTVGSQVERTRTHTLTRVLIVGERADRVGIAELSNLCMDWPDAIDDAYRADVTLLGTCSRSEVLRLKPYQDALLGTKGFGVIYTVLVVARPKVLTKG